MPKQILFDDDSEEEVAIKTENSYAKKYDQWREKEEIHKLEQKYGSKALNSDASVSSDSEDESDEPPEISEETETQFLKTLALLKTKDPRIYDSNYKFFDDEKEKEPEKEKKIKTLTFEDSDEDDDGGDIFSIEKKAEIVDDKKNNVDNKKNAKEGKLKEYLTGKVEHIDHQVEQDLAPLKALWSDPKLNEGEAFLRDYILNKRYLDEGDIGDAADKIRDDDDLEADEKMVEEQGKFERAYNFRFEEPDDEYLKRFPRTMNYIRPKDDSRARKRAELRARKLDDKKRKLDEIARLKALKLKEIQDKLAKIKEVTGNDDLAFKDEDIEGDFNPEEHDQRMQAIFNEEYYGDVDEEKPVFPDLDEELEIENWENYELEHENEEKQQGEGGAHCEDEDFNMDADYDPKKARENLLEQLQRNMGKKRRNRKKKSKLAEVLSTDKPKFVPTVVDKTYAQYMEEYYKMDCEDIIGGDLPTRFKYREVVPCDYGLTIEEILLADDKELTQWVPLKTLVKHRPANIEKGEVKTYAQKAADVRLKKKVLPSLFKDLPEEPEIVVPIEEATKKKKKKKKNKKKDTEPKEENEQTDVEIEDQNKVAVDTHEETKHKEDNKVEDNTEGNNEEEINKEIKVEVSANNKKKKKRKLKDVTDKATEEVVVENTVESNPEEKKNKVKNQAGFIIENILNEENVPCKSVASTVSNGAVNKNTNNQKVNLKRKLANTEDAKNPKKKKNNKNNGNPSNVAKNTKRKDPKFKSKLNKNNDGKSENPLNTLSDERLKAYGLNPKKYRGFLKYKKF